MSVPLAVLTPVVAAERRRPGISLLHNKTLLAGIALLFVIVMMVVLAPVLAPADPNQQNLFNVLARPGPGHLLGTDDLGRDTWARLLYGGRVDLMIGVSAVIAPFILGSTLGLLAGYLGGWVDAVIMRVLEVVVAFPFYVLIIAVVFALGAGVSSIFIAITAVGWVSYCRIVRGEVLVAKRLGYVEAARAAGLSTPRILIRHLTPNVLTQALIYSMSDIVLTILAVVTLGFLGLGVQPPTAEWGAMLQAGFENILTDPILGTVPGIAVVITGLAFSLIGDGLAAEFGKP
ncbi:MAG: ABC transporter permease [Candidatus Dormiibacterota bacterium]